MRRSASQQHAPGRAVGFKNSARGLDLGVYAVRSYSLMRPPRTGRRLILSRERSATGRVTWQGSRLLRSALIEAIQRVPADAVTGAVKDAIVARRGKEARNIARIAAARRLLTLVSTACAAGRSAACRSPPGTWNLRRWTEAAASSCPKSACPQRTLRFRSAPPVRGQSGACESQPPGSGATTGTLAPVSCIRPTAGEFRPLRGTRCGSVRLRL